MKKVIVSIGIAGSGKSTTLKAFAKKHGYIYISSDEIREELTGDARNQRKNSEVFLLIKTRLTDELRAGRTVVVDATFVDAEKRKEFLEFSRKAGAEKIEGLFFDAPIETAKERNAARDRKVPEYAIDRMRRSIEHAPPEIHDGFDALFTLNENGELVTAEKIHEGEITSREFKKVH